MAAPTTLEIPISGMDCAECTQHVRHAIEQLPGVQSVNVFLGSEKAVVRLDPARVAVVVLVLSELDIAGVPPAAVARARASAPATPAR